MIKAQKNTFRLFSLCVLFAFLACASHPPKEKGVFRNSDLVELVKLDSSIHLDIRYATKNNFTGQVVYTQARAFLQRPAALSLLKVHQKLRPLGYGLLVFDGYRPWYVSKTFWEITPKKDREKFVADPKKGSKHNRGCAIDLSLYELASGKAVEMPSEYDEFTERAFSTYGGGTETQREMRTLLRTQMEAEDFISDEYEWWHFDYKDWKSYKIENIAFEEIK